MRLHRLIHTPSTLAQVAGWLKTARLETPHELIIRPARSKRSLEQNRLPHLWLRVIADECGCTPEGAKEDVCRELLGVETVHGPRGILERRVSTTSLTVEQFARFLTRLQAWAGAELGIYLPSPGDHGYAEMEERYGIAS